MTRQPATHPGGIVEVGVTRRQARLMAEAIWALEQRCEQLAEMAGVDRRKPPVKDQIMLAEIRRRLYLAASQP